MVEEFLFPPDAAGVVAQLCENKSFSHGEILKRHMAAARTPRLAPQDAWALAASKPKVSARRAIYIHVPFCLRRCSFCSFYSNETRKSDLDAYTETVLAEMRLALAGTPQIAEEPIDVVYFGGGTPTDLSSKNLGDLVSFIFKNFKIAPEYEFTVEGRTSGFEADKIRVCVENGVNRFSFGVQTFDTALRRELGRMMSKGELVERLALVRKIGGGNVSLMLDFIYGLPSQTPELWAEDLRLVTDVVPVDGVDLYQLKLLPGTPLTRVGKELSYEERFALFLTARERLASRGWKRLSMTHWGRTPRERNWYNHGTKTGMEILPFGSRAGGFLGGFSFMQHMDLEKYMRAVADGNKGVTAAMPDNPGVRFKNLVTHQLELGYFEPETIFPPILAEKTEKIWTNWVAAGLLVPAAGGRFTLSPLGEYWHTTLISYVLRMLMQLAMMMPGGNENFAGPPNSAGTPGKTECVVA